MYYFFNFGNFFRVVSVHHTASHIPLYTQKSPLLNCIFVKFSYNGTMKIQKNLPPLVIWLLFETIAVTLWLTLDNIFYLFNFSYIGTALAAGLVLFGQKKTYARNAVQFAVGLYMLVYLGFLCRENMQIEGFWYYLFLGVFEAATIHYAIAKYKPAFYPSSPEQRGNYVVEFYRWKSPLLCHWNRSSLSMQRQQSLL